ncbi:MAG TPA: A/G-specific adenine glycosylase [Acidimicrobiales bacterium]|nr:A/G-specific adenine glycosylase [Acidimicrobiales bacterium]
MLQQTQVARVLPRYHAFLARFPDPATCAASPLGRVIESWAGLGYNRRAVNLHRAARLVVDRYQGRLPANLDDLLALPGVGHYTARAVLAFAFEQPTGVVDTNAARVLARAVAGRRLTTREAQTLADDQVPAGRAWAWNQAMLDLGAAVCTSRAPNCRGCPVRGSCRWRVAGYATTDPAAGSAGTSGRQSTFAGSDRQGRGRLMDALRRGPVPLDRLAEAAGWSDAPGRASRVAAGLVVDGLAVEAAGRLLLPIT